MLLVRHDRTTRPARHGARAQERSGGATFEAAWPRSIVAVVLSNGVENAEEIVQWMNALHATGDAWEAAFSRGAIGGPERALPEMRRYERGGASFPPVVTRKLEGDGDGYERGTSNRHKHLNELARKRQME